MSIHEQIAKHDSKINELYQMIGDLQKWQSTVVENWMRRVEERFDILNANISNSEIAGIPKIVDKIPKLFNNQTHVFEMLDNLSKRVDKIENWIQQQRTLNKTFTTIFAPMLEKLTGNEEAIAKYGELVAEFIDTAEKRMMPETSVQVFDLEKVMQQIDKDLHPDSEPEPDTEESNDE